jgi:hypothetical protein
VEAEKIEEGVVRFEIKVRQRQKRKDRNAILAKTDGMVILD